ncbi:MAG: hypothetical protein U0414_28270 [Polyangiaceae bacterium]
MRHERGLERDAAARGLRGRTRRAGEAFPVSVSIGPASGGRIHVEGFDARSAELGVREAPVRRGQSLDATPE